MIVVFGGPSGSGKDYLAKSLEFPKILSVTTRAPRLGEVNGVDYLFVSDEEYERLQEEDAFAECIPNYTGNGSRYGILKETMDEVIASGQDYYAAVDYRGYLQLKKLYPAHVIGFSVYTPKEVCVQRMFKRGDVPDTIARRASTWEEETAINCSTFDWILSNDGRVSHEHNVEVLKFLIEQKRQAV